MKKLMIMMAAIATGAMAWATGEPAPLDAQVTYTVPTDAEVGPTNIVGYSDNFQTPYTTTGANVHWWMPGFVIGTTEDPLTVAEIEVAGETEPTTAKVLQLESSAESPVLRTFTPVGTEGDYDAVTIDDHGTFVDTWVKLSASEGALEAQTDDKIAVWLQVVEEETDDQGVVTVPAATNLVVTCGALSQTFVPTTTNVVLDANIVPDTWHRITIRAMKGIANDTATYKNIGFLVYIDGVIAAAKEGAYLDFTDVELSAEAQKYANVRQLFPSLQQDEAATLTAAGFAGVGQIASVNLDTQHSAPAFAKDPTYVRITCDANVESVALNGEELEFLDGSVTVPVDGPYAGTGYVSGTQTLTITYAENYKCLDVDDEGLVTFNRNDAGTTVEFTLAEFAVGATIAITSQRDREGASAYVFDSTAGEFVPLFNGATQPYLFNMVGKIAEAIEAGDIDPDATVKIVLLENEVATTTGNWRNLSCNIVLDLNGHSLTAGDDWTGGYEDDPEDPTIIMYCNNAVICGFSTVSIVDESITGGGAIIGNTTLQVGAIYNRGAMVIEDADGSTPITFNGVVFNDASNEGVMTICGGMFSAKAIGENITLNDGVNELTWVDPAEEGGYYTLAPVGADVVPYSVGSEATADLVITIDDVAAVPSGNITAGSVLKVVATAKTGYQYTGSEQHGDDWLFDNNAWTFTKTAADTQITVTVPVATAVINYIVSVKAGEADAVEFADVASALAAVQSAEGAGTFPIVVTALADDVEVVNPEDPTQTITLAEGDVITITATGWEFAQVLTGTVELAPGKTIVAVNGSTATITAPEGYMIVSTPGEFTTTYEAKEILATVQVGEEAAVNFCDLAAVLEAVQAAEVAETFPIVVTAVGAERTFELGEQSITLGEDEMITIAKAGSWKFSNLFVGKVLLVAGNEIIAKGIADDGSAILVDEDNGYELKDSEPVEGYITYTAELKTLTATFVVEGEQEPFDVQYVTYGEMAVAPDPAPTKTGYTFTGWTPAFAALTANQIYTAQFAPNPATLTLPTLPDGVAGATVYQSVDGATGWEPVTEVLGAYPIAAGNFYKVAVTAAQHYDRVADGKIISEKPVEAGEEIAITTAQLEALVQLHSYNITYKQVNEQPITGLNPATFTIAVAVELPTDLGAQLGGTFKGWYANAELTGDQITGWTPGGQTDDVTVYAKIEQVIDDAQAVLDDKVNTTGLTPEQAGLAKENARVMLARLGDKAAVETWIANVYGESAKIDGAKLAAASAENVEIAMKYDIEIMEDPVIEFNATVAATEGNVAAFTFQIKDGDEGEAVSLAKAKVLSMVQYCSTLGSWAAATAENVAVSVDGATAKAELIQKTGITAGFMKIQLTAPAEEAK